MVVIPFGSPALCQVRPPLALDSTTAPFPDEANMSVPMLNKLLPDTQQSEAVGHAKPVKNLVVGKPWAGTVDQVWPPL